MVKHIEKLCRDPFAIHVGKKGAWYFIDPKTGDIQFGSAIFHAANGWTFYLTEGRTRHVLKLQSAKSTFDIGWTDDADVTNWVKTVNRFLEAQRGSTESNGKLRRKPPRKAQTAKTK
jgi:hypothetical protein